MLGAAPRRFSISDFSLGWDNMSSPGSLDPRCVADSKNFNIGFRGSLEKRKGIAKMYPDSAGAASIHSLFEYQAPLGAYILVGIGTTLLYYDDEWHTIKSGLTAAKRFTFAMSQGFCYAANGVDDNFKLYNATAWGVGIAPPEAKPTVALDTGTLTGKYRYVYCYRRTTHKVFTGNPSPVSDEISPSAQGVKVTVVASTDSQVNKIAIYRTLNLNASGVANEWYFVAEINNASGDYVDTKADDELTSLCETDNTVPPKAKFICLHKDRIVFASVGTDPLMAGGGSTSLVRWSKKGIGDAAPSTNYQYFDRDDGQDITGVCSVGDYLIIFKKTKIAVLAGDLSSAENTQFYTIHNSVGSIAPWALIPLEDKVVFLSEEGWKACNGRETFSYSPRINAVVKDGYCSYSQAQNISAVYYPAREQFQYLINHSMLNKLVFAGHFILPLMIVTGEIPEQKTEHLVGWTYHQYESHILTCLGTYTDSAGITRPMAGSAEGYVYKLDTGVDDDGNNIHCLMKTDATPLGAAHELTKDLRFLYMSYMTDAEGDVTVTTDVDDFPGSAIDVVVGANAAYCGYCYCGFCYCGVDGSVIDLLRHDLTGKHFRVTVEQNTPSTLVIRDFMFRYRTRGLRD